MKSLPQFFALAVTALIAGSASAAQVWVAPAAQKIRPAAQAPAGATASASIAAAKNEFESFQVVVTGQAAGVSMAIEGLSDGAGHTISGRDVVLYREALLNVASQTGQKLKWDRANLKVTNSEAADKIVSPPRRPGWEL